MANKIGRNKKSCENYRLSGKLQTNKALKTKRHEKRMAKFEQRREEGKTYEYKSNPYTKGTYEYEFEKELRAAKNVDRKTPVARFTSNMRKLKNQLDKEKMVRKERKEKSQRNRKVIEA